MRVNYLALAGILVILGYVAAASTFGWHKDLIPVQIECGPQFIVHSRQCIEHKPCAENDAACRDQCRRDTWRLVCRGAEYPGSLIDRMKTN